MTASALKKESNHTKAEVERFLTGEENTRQTAFVLKFPIKNALHITFCAFLIFAFECGTEKIRFWNKVQEGGRKGGVKGGGRWEGGVKGRAEKGDGRGEGVVKKRAERGK